MSTPAIPHSHESGLDAVLKKMPVEGSFASAAEVFSQLSDPSRLRILWVICHCEECVTNIAAAVGMSHPAVSHHLRILKDNGTVKSRRIGKEVHYSLANTEEARLLHKMIDDIFLMNCPETGIL